MATSDTLTRLQVQRFRRRVGKARLAKVRRLIARERRAATKPKPVVVPEPPPPSTNSALLAFLGRSKRGGTATTDSTGNPPGPDARAFKGTPAEVFARNCRGAQAYDIEFRSGQPIFRAL